MLLVVPNFHEVNSPRPPSTWLPLSVCPQGWGTVISGGSPPGLGHPISQLPQSNKQFRLKFLLLSFCSSGMGFYILWHVPNRVYSCPSGTSVVEYVPESILFMVLNFPPSILGNPPDHIWVFRCAFPTRWCFHACAWVPMPQIDATHPERMHD